MQPILNRENKLKNPLLSVKDLKVHFPMHRGFFKKSAQYLKAVDNVSFDIYQGESVGLVGESGSGKTTLARAILGLVDEVYSSGNSENALCFDGISVLGLNKNDKRALRKDMQLIFQDPFSSLNPRMTIGRTIEEGLFVNKIFSKEERRKKAVEILELVGLDSDYYSRYPHEFSGGQRQRIGIARALILNPKLIIADEPVSALDVSIQLQILKLMESLKKSFNLTYLFVAHDLSVVYYFCSRIIVMYLGKIMEEGTGERIVKNPSHPYTKALLSAVPIPDPEYIKDEIILTGDIPSPIDMKEGCVFKSRCYKKMDICEKKSPPFFEIEKGHKSACWLYDKSAVNKA
jgi:oligopeptide transport system ATP-binding protein